MATVRVHRLIDMRAGRFSVWPMCRESAHRQVGREVAERARLVPIQKDLTTALPPVGLAAERRHGEPSGPPALVEVVARRV
jgi:hypothetical protein